MSIGSFTDKQRPPTMQEVLDAAGNGRPAWENITRHIEENYRAKTDLRFYGKNYGWAVRFRKSGKSLLSLYPGNDSLTAQIVLSAPEAEKAAALDLGDKVRQVLENAHPYPEGRWLFIRVESVKDIDDVKQLLATKRVAESESKRRRANCE